MYKSASFVKEPWHQDSYESMTSASVKMIPGSTLEFISYPGADREKSQGVRSRGAPEHSEGAKPSAKGAGVCVGGLSPPAGGSVGLPQKNFCFRSALRAYLMQSKSILQDETPRRLEWKGHPIFMHSFIISAHSLPAAILITSKLGNWATNKSVQERMLFTL